MELRRSAWFGARGVGACDDGGKDRGWTVPPFADAHCERSV